MARWWPLFNSGILLILRNLDQPVFGSRILKGQKNEFEYFHRILNFELCLTSLDVSTSFVQKSHLRSVQVQVRTGIGIGTV